MAVWIGIRIEHRLHPGDAEQSARVVARALDVACFTPLTRIAMGVKDREKRYAAKCIDVMTEFLLDPSCDDLILDSGRAGDLIASARIPSGRHAKGYDDPRALIGSFAVVPAPTATSDLVDGVVELVAALGGIAGFIAAEPGFDRAHRAVHNKPPRHDDVPDYPEIRARERIAHDWYGKRIEAEIAGPDWGLVLGPEHLKRIEPDPTVFPIVRNAGVSKAVFLTSNVEDALSESFDARLDAARKALARLLMDVSNVPVS